MTGWTAAPGRRAVAHGVAHAVEHRVAHGVEHRVRTPTGP
jgi:hypothetical protein